MTPHPRQCTAKSKRSGERCRRWAVAGGKVCPTHGGKAKQVQAAAKRRLAEEKARKAVVTLGLPRVVGPAEALLEEVHRTAGHVAWLGGKVQELEDRSLVWGETKSEQFAAGDGDEDADRPPALKATEEAKPSVWYTLYAAERDRLVKVSSEALKAGVEERRVRMAESQGALVAGLVQRVLGALFDRLVQDGVPAETLRKTWSAAVAEIVPREFRALSA